MTNTIYPKPLTYENNVSFSIKDDDNKKFSVPVKWVAHILHEQIRVWTKVNIQFYCPFKNTILANGIKEKSEINVEIPVDSRYIVLLECNDDDSYSKFLFEKLQRSLQSNQPNSSLLPKYNLKEKHKIQDKRQKDNKNTQNTDNIEDEARSDTLDLEKLQENLHLFSPEERKIKLKEQISTYIKKLNILEESGEMKLGILTKPFAYSLQPRKYENPTSTYDNPTSTYNNPTSTYDNPTSTYNNPTSTYNNPTSSIYNHSSNKKDNPNSIYDNSSSRKSPRKTENVMSTQPTELDDHNNQVRSTMEQLLYSYLRDLALTNLCEGNHDVERITIQCNLAETCARMNLWRQALGYAKKALNDLDSLNEITEDNPKGVCAMSGCFQESILSATNCKEIFSLFRILNTSGIFQYEEKCAKYHLIHAMSMDRNVVAFLQSSSSFQGLHNTERCTKLLDTIDNDGILWCDLIHCLYQNDLSFKTYIDRLETTLPYTMIQSLKHHFRDLSLSFGDTIPIDQLLRCMESLDGDSQWGTIRCELKTKFHGETRSLSWPEVVEHLQGIICQENSQFLKPRLLLLVGKYHLHMEELPDMLKILRYAIVEQEALVGQDHLLLTEFYLTMAKALLCNHENTTRLSRQKAQKNVELWLSTPEGSCQFEAELAKFVPTEDCLNEKRIDSQNESEEKIRFAFLQQKSEAVYILPSTQDLDEAQELLIKTLRILEKTHTASHIDRAKILTVLGKSCIQKGQLEEAKSVLTEAIQIYLACLGAPTPVVAELQIQLGHLLKDMNDMATSSSFFEAAASYYLKRAEASPEWESTRRDAANKSIEAWRNALNLQMDNIPEMERLLKNILLTLEIGYGPYSIQVAEGCKELAHHFWKYEDTEHATKEMTRYYRIIEAMYGVGNKKTLKAWNDLQSLDVVLLQKNTTST